MREREGRDERGEEIDCDNYGFFIGLPLLSNNNSGFMGGLSKSIMEGSSHVNFYC